MAAGQKLVNFLFPKLIVHIHPIGMVSTRTESPASYKLVHNPFHIIQNANQTCFELVLDNKDEMQFLLKQNKLG